MQANLLNWVDSFLLGEPRLTISGIIWGVAAFPERASTIKSFVLRPFPPDLASCFSVYSHLLFRLLFSVTSSCDLPQDAEEED